MISKEELKILTNAISNLAEKNTLENIKMFLEMVKKERMHTTLSVDELLNLTLMWLQQSIDVCDRKIRE